MVVCSAKEGEKWCLGCVKMKGWRRVFIGEREGNGSAIMGGYGRESGLNLKGEVGGDLWRMDVSGEEKDGIW